MIYRYRISISISRIYRYRISISISRIYIYIYRISISISRIIDIRRYVCREDIDIEKI
jgi:hypothetical protein